MTAEILIGIVILILGKTQGQFCNPCINNLESYSNGICLSCAVPNCALCEFENNLLCQFCKQNYILINDTSCIRESKHTCDCDYNKIIQEDGSCKTCEINNCVLCQYDDNLKCEFCKVGFVLSDDSEVCEKQVVSGCRCPFNEIYDTGECVECIILNCALCAYDNQTDCQFCMPGYIMIDNGCQKCSGKFCQDNDDNSEFQPYYGLVLGLSIPLSLIVIFLVVLLIRLKNNKISNQHMMMKQKKYQPTQVFEEY